MADLNVLRTLYDLPSIVSHYTQETGRKIVCPMPHHEHHHMTPSFSMFVGPDGIQRFKCFGTCGVQGDVIDFLGFYHLGPTYNSNNPEHIELAVKYLTGESIQAKRTPLKKKHKPLNPTMAEMLVSEFERNLRNSYPAKIYLDRRGVLDVAPHFRLGYKFTPLEYVKGNTQVPGHYISIPTIQNGRVISIKLRRIDSHPDYIGIEDLPIRYDSVAGQRIGAGQPGIFNHDHIAYTTGFVFSPEGEFDVMLAQALGYEAWCFNTGGNVTCEIGPILAHAFTIIIADNDETGLRHAMQKQALLDRSEIVCAPESDLGALYDKGEDYARIFLDATLGDYRNTRAQWHATSLNSE